METASGFRQISSLLPYLAEVDSYGNQATDVSTYHWNCLTQCDLHLNKAQAKFPRFGPM